jgi:hypothetical protein
MASYGKDSTKPGTKLATKEERWSVIVSLNNHSIPSQ